ncbi:helix-turn-helix domain-containing protein [Streptomyces sp. NPDC057486]|uniref:helix-turn-helix domain-containing protein n=1 Tax=Streptomyces sp. NPDC057486 TaxID=3346145 RepID=UPI00367AEB7D
MSPEISSQCMTVQCRATTQYCLIVTSEALKVRAHSHVQVADYGRGAVFGPRVLQAYELVWLLAGSAQWQTEMRDADGAVLGEEDLLLSPGTLALARRGDRESYYWDASRESSHAFVHFSLDSPGHLGHEATWPRVRDMSEAPILQALCAYLLDLADLQSTRSRRRSDECVQLLLDLFIAGPLSQESPQFSPIVRAAVEHVAEVWSTSGYCIVSVEEMAAAATVSTGHLHRLFRDSYACGPARAFELIRLARAAMSLQRSNLSLAEIATEAGFSTPYHFSRRFAETYGTPPGAFRRTQSAVDALWPVRQARLLPLVHLLP